MPIFDFHTQVAYTATFKDGTTEEVGNVACFGTLIMKELQNKNVVKVVYHPTTVPGKHAYIALGEKGLSYPGGTIGEWVGFLNNMLGKAVFGFRDPSSIIYNKPEDASFQTFKFHLFLMRAPFNNPALGLLATKFFKTIKGERLWKVLMFLSLLPFNRDWGLIHDSGHPLAVDSSYRGLESLPKVLERLQSPTAKSVVNSFWKYTFSYDDLVKGTKSPTSTFFTKHLKTSPPLADVFGKLDEYFTKTLLPMFLEFEKDPAINGEA